MTKTKQFRETDVSCVQVSQFKLDHISNANTTIRATLWHIHDINAALRGSLYKQIGQCCSMLTDISVILNICSSQPPTVTWMLQSTCETALFMEVDVQ